MSRRDGAGVSDDPFDQVGIGFLLSSGDRCSIGIHSGHRAACSSDGQGDPARAAAEIQDAGTVARCRDVEEELVISPPTC